MNSNDKMRCRKVRRVLRYHTPNKHQYPEKYAHHLLLLFCPFRSKNELLGGTSHTYQEKYFEDGVTKIIRNNQRKFEPYAELADEAYENFNAELIDNQNAYGQIENDETITASYSEDSTERDGYQNSSENLSSSSLMPEIPPDNEIAGSTRSLNEKQRMVFNVVHKWSRNFIKRFTVDPIRIFLSESEGTGKSHLIKTIYQVVSKELLYHA